MNNIARTNKNRLSRLMQNDMKHFQFWNNDAVNNWSGGFTNIWQSHPWRGESHKKGTRMLIRKLKLNI